MWWPFLFSKRWFALRVQFNWHLMFGLTVLCILLGVSVIGLFLFSTNSRSGTWRETGTLRVGYAVEPPYAFVDKKLRITGESPETFRLVADAAGIKSVVWIQTPFSVLIPDLLSGRIDVIAAGMFANQEREKVVAFTNPTLRVNSGLLIRNDLPAREKSLVKQLSSEGGTIAAIAGSVEIARLPSIVSNDTSGSTQVRILSVPDARTGINSVVIGRAKAFALSWPSVSWAAKTNRDSLLLAVKLPASENATDQTAFVVRKGDDALLNALNRGVASVLGTPKHLEVIRSYGFEEDDLP